MKLLFLSEANLRDRLFVRDLVFNYKTKERSLLIHAPFGDAIRDSRFVTKRISSLLSEAMVYNRAFSADQRNFFSLKNGELEIDPDKIKVLLDVIQVLVIGPVVNQDGTPVLADPLEMVRLAQQQLTVGETIIFPANPLSPIGQGRPLIDQKEELDKLRPVYEEETELFQTAEALMPVRICLPNNYIQ